MLARGRLLPSLRARCRSSYICEPRTVSVAEGWHVSSTRALHTGKATLVPQQQQRQQRQQHQHHQQHQNQHHHHPHHHHQRQHHHHQRQHHHHHHHHHQQQQQQYRALSTAPVVRGNLKRTHGPLGAIGGNSRARFASSRANKVARSSRVEKPAIPSFIEIRELASLLRVKPKALLKSLGGYQEKKMHRVVLSGIPYAFPKLGNVIVPFQDAHSVANTLGKPIRFLDVDKKPERTALALPSGAHDWEDGASGNGGRRPVVVLLGHFNHGKTTILDALLGPGSGIAEREAGGITQEIRARTVSLKQSQGNTETLGDSPEGVAPPRQTTVATFLDTPGQEIFYRMRTNGARVADAVLLVVSAVDGICLQTSESIGCAEELGLPAVVALNKVDLLPDGEAVQRVKELSQEVREFVAIENAKVLPLSARTGHGLDDLRASLAAALSRTPPPSQRPLCVETLEHPRLDAAEPEKPSPLEMGDGEVGVPAALTGDETELFETAEGVHGEEIAVMEAPEGAATATVLDYTSSAKTGKMLLLLVDRGVLRPGDFFVSGSLWGSVRSIFDEEGARPLECAGPGVAAKVVVVARTSVSDAPLGEPFRVLTRDCAEKVALVRALTRTIDSFIDHRRLERDFPHLLLEEDTSSEASLTKEPDGPGEPYFTRGADKTGAPSAAGQGEPSFGGGTGKMGAPSAEGNGHEQRKGLAVDHDGSLSEEDMPVTIVVKADSANTLASILDALGDWGDVERAKNDFPRDSQEPSTSQENSEETSEGRGSWDEDGRREAVQIQRQDWGEGDLQHKQRRRLVVSVARSGVGAVTSSDVVLARDCECPVFAHNVSADAAAARELRRVGGGVVPAIAEGVMTDGADVGVGGQEGFIGRAGEGRECVVVSETVGELLGEIERFVLRVR